MKKHWVTIVVGIVCAVAFFFIGRATVGTGAAAGRGAFASSTRTGAFAGRTGAAGGGFVSGTVVSVDNGVITVSLANGNSENVYYSSSTSIIKPQPASASSLVPGTMVMIGGTSNPDGSVTASTIQVRAATTGTLGTGSATGSGTGSYGGGAGQ